MAYRKAASNHISMSGASLTFVLLNLCPGFLFAQAPPTPTQMSVLWEVNAGGGAYTDWMTSVSPNEFKSLPFLGAMSYVPAYQAGSPPLYRLHSGLDHMDSSIPGEGGYATDGPLAYPWTSSSTVNGLSSIARMINPSTGDHATASPFAESLYPGYQLEGMLPFYGYQRYGNLPSAVQYFAAGGVTEGSDTVAGGAVAYWAWNGAQLIDTHDYGRLMQADVQWSSGGAYFNPTEAGDLVSGTNYGQVGMWHGSPTLQNEISGSIHVTRAVPLEFGNSGPNCPIVTPSNLFAYTTMQIGKNLTLNFANMGQVAQYQTYVYTPTPITNATVEIPTAYIQANYNTFFSYDAGKNVVSAFPVAPTCDGTTPGTLFKPSSSHGGVIISNSAGTIAIGIYGPASNSPSGLPDYLAIFNHSTCPNGPFTKWSAVHYGNLSSGDNVFTRYIVTGSLSQIVPLMRQLYLSGY